MKMINKEGPIVIVSKKIEFTFPFGLAYIAGYLRSKGEDVRVLFRPEKSYDYASFASEIINMKPAMVGFGSLYPDLYPIADIIKHLREKKALFPIVIGGQMVSPTPEFALEVTGADIGVVGEGEMIIHNLLGAMREEKDLSEVKGLVLKKDGEIILTGEGEFFKDLSLLPDIPYDLFPSDMWLNAGRYYARAGCQSHWRFNDKVGFVHGGRGCPHNCNFCYHHSVPRYRPISNMIEDINYIHEHYKANLFSFSDDLVIATPKRANELVEALNNLPYKIDFNVSCRFDVLSRMSDDLLKGLKEAGCRSMGIGIESGSQKILDAIGKKITIEQMIDGFDRLEKNKIIPAGNIMVGEVGENREDVELSRRLAIDMVRKNKHFFCSFSVVTPFPGSILYDEAKEKGLIKDDMDFYKKFDPGRQMGALSVNFTDLSDKEVIDTFNSLSKEYSEERKKVRGFALNFMESIINFIGFGDYALDRLVWRIKVFKPLFYIYSPIYNLTQTMLDKIRLAFLFK